MLPLLIHNGNKNSHPTNNMQFNIPIITPLGATYNILQMEQLFIKYTTRNQHFHVLNPISMTCNHKFNTCNAIKFCRKIKGSIGGEPPFPCKAQPSMGPPQHKETHSHLSIFYSLHLILPLMVFLYYYFF